MHGKPYYHYVADIDTIESVRTVVAMVSRYDEFKRIRGEAPRDWVELTMARSVFVVFIVIIIYHLLSQL